MSDQVTRCYFT